MGHRCFISFKTEDKEYKRTIQEKMDIDMIDKSLNEPIDSDDEDYIMRKIREDYLQDSTVTICLIGQHSAENNWLEDQRYIKRELQASLYGNPNGVLGVVLPDEEFSVYKGESEDACPVCKSKHNIVCIDDSTVIKEFSKNYYIEKDSDNGCSAWKEDERYCILAKWEEFKNAPEDYIQQAFDKRSAPIANKIKVFPK